MIVQASRIGLAAQSTVSLTRERTETTRAWIGNQRPDFERLEAEAAPDPRSGRDRMDISRQARAALEAQRAHASAGVVLEDDPSTAPRTGETEDGREVELSPQDELKIRMIEDLLSQVLGREVKLSRFRGLALHDGQAAPGATGESGTPGPNGTAGPTGSIGQAGGQAPRAGWGIESTVEERSVKAERMAFSAQGQVRTADGKDVAFALDLSMERVTVEQSRLEIRLGDAVRKDPLVVNFGGAAAELTDRAFAFDLDADGATDSVHLATGSSAFLARDPGTEPLDGRILFGPRTGDGFGELAALDGDANGWIDEADAAWKDLRLWSRDETGKDNLRTLTEAGVGALYVGAVATPWELDGGAVAKTGVWLGEPGTGQAGAGTVQHVDLYV